MNIKQEYIALHCADVRAHPEYFKASMQDNPEGWVSNMIDGLTEEEIHGLLVELKEELKALPSTII